MFEQKRWLVFVSLFCLIGLCLAPRPVNAQSGDGTPVAEPAEQGEASQGEGSQGEGPGAAATPGAGQSPDTPPTEEAGGDEAIPRVHIVQDGETLFSIAQLYDTTIETLQLLNNISDPSVLFVGQQLVIPGGGGSAVATVHITGVGDTLASLAEAYNTSIENIALANRLITTNHLVAGQPLTVLSRTGSAAPTQLTGNPYIVQEGDSLLTIAVQNGLSPLAVANTNNLPINTYLFPGQRLRLPGEGNYQYLSGPWGRIEMRSLPAVQGETEIIYVEPLLPGLPTGQFAGQPLRFTPFDNGYAAIFGIDAFTEPGRYQLALDGQGNQPWRPFTQDVQIQSGNYGTQSITIPDELAYLLAPEIRANEDAFLATIYGNFSEQAFWQSAFQLPLTNTVVTAGFGSARSYNGGPIEIYHSGIDFSGTTGTPIYSPAAGTVAFTGTLEVRGNTLIIDHGLGVFSGYYHLSEFIVGIGETVTAGQHIANGGSTGLSSGPHLHWDVRVNNVPVNGNQWTEEWVNQFAQPAGE